MVVVDSLRSTGDCGKLHALTVLVLMIVAVTVIMEVTSGEHEPQRNSKQVTSKSSPVTLPAASNTTQGSSPLLN